MLPAGSQFFLHPIAYTRTFFEVLKLTSDYNTQETIERRRARVEDVAKRDAYRKAHGMDKQQGFGGWTAKSDDEVLGSGMRIGDGKKAEVGVDDASPVVEDVQQEQHQPERERRPLKKWLGIW